MDFGEEILLLNNFLNQVPLGTPVIENKDFKKAVAFAPTFLGMERVIHFCLLRFIQLNGVNIDPSLNVSGTVTFPRPEPERPAQRISHVSLRTATAPDSAPPGSLSLCVEALVIAQRVPAGDRPERSSPGRRQTPLQYWLQCANNAAVVRDAIEQVNELSGHGWGRWNLPRGGERRQGSPRLIGIPLSEGDPTTTQCCIARRARSFGMIDQCLSRKLLLPLRVASRAPRIDRSAQADGRYLKHTCAARLFHCNPLSA
jgi:hypothetical protein